jgi:hypothetical protein
LLLSFLRLRDLRSGYGGALSVYFGLSAGLQQLEVSQVSLVLRNNVFEKCEVSVSAQGGNSYGGAVSIYMGAYSSSTPILRGDAAAAAGNTVVRNVNVTLDTSRFASCSARREFSTARFGSNVYGGSFSFYIGAYAWSLSDASSSSTCGATDVMGVDVRVQHVTSVDCSAFNSGTFFGANAYGGTMSVLYIGAYSYSRGFSGSSSSKCEATNVSGVSVQVSDSGCFNCSAVSSSKTSSAGANSYGGAMSLLYVGAYSFSGAPGNDDPDMYSKSFVATTQVDLLSIAIKNSSFENSTALSGECCLSNCFKCRRANTISNIRS